MAPSRTRKGATESKRKIWRNHDMHTDMCMCLDVFRWMSKKRGIYRQREGER